MVGGEGVDRPLATEPVKAGILLPTVGGVGFVVDGDVVDVGNPRVHTARKTHTPFQVTGEHRAGKVVIGAVGDTWCVLLVLGPDHRGHGPEGLLVGTCDVVVTHRDVGWQDPSGGSCRLPRDQEFSPVGDRSGDLVP